MFVALEGPDAVGKTTICNSLDKKETDYSIYTTKEPGSQKVETCNRIREMLLESEHLCSETEFYLFLADRVEHYHKEIAEALESYDIVVTDRYALSTAIYQLRDKYLENSEIRELFHKVHSHANIPYPDLSLVFDASYETINNRMDDDRDRIEKKSKDFHKSIIKNFRGLLNEDYPNIEFVDAEQSKEDVLDEVYEKIMKYYVQKGLMAE